MIYTIEKMLQKKNRYKVFFIVKGVAQRFGNELLRVLVSDKR